MDLTFWVVSVENLRDQRKYKKMAFSSVGMSQTEIRVPFLRSHFWYEFQPLATRFSVNVTDYSKW